MPPGSPGKGLPQRPACPLLYAQLERRETQICDAFRTGSPRAMMNIQHIGVQDESIDSGAIDISLLRDIDAAAETSKDSMTCWELYSAVAERCQW